MSHDIRSILERLAVVEGSVTPVTVKNGLNPQQKSVPQLPALFRPKSIRVLGSKTDPEHPMKGYAVGGAAEAREPARNSLEEAMQEVEEDMLSKVRKDLNNYLVKLEKTVKIDRDLADKAKDAVQRHAAEEDIEEDDYELTDPSTVHGIEDKVDTALGNPQQPVKVMELDDGNTFEIHERGTDEYEIQHRGHSLPSRFKSPEEASIAVDLFRAHRNRKMQSAPAARQEFSQDYIEEK